MRDKCATTDLDRPSRARFSDTRDRAKGRRFRCFTLLVLVFAVPSTLTFADLRQVFVDGQAGHFEKARSELQNLSNSLETMATSADITTVGRNCAAIGF